MFESIPTLRDELATRLEQSLPHDWQILQDIQAPNATLGPAVYVEFVGLSSQHDSATLPHGVVSAEVNLIVTDPRTTAQGEAGAEELIVELIGVLDPHTDLAWQNARKLRVESSGVWSWQLTLSAFVATDALTETEA